MKQTLAFLTSEDFQNFTAQLIGEETPNFMAIEGAGGDGGLDGLSGTTAYQMYFPEVKNRQTRNYIAKIDDSLAKLQVTIAKEGYEVNRWVFVVPDDLHFKVAIHLRKRSKELGIDCIYWGATRLTALISKHPHIRDNFPAVYLPDVKQSLGTVSASISKLGNRRIEHDVEIVTDSEYMAQKEALREELRAHVRSTRGSLRDPTIDSGVYRDELDKKFKALDVRKNTSDRYFELELADLNEQFNEEVTEKRAEHQRRGVMGAGFAVQDIEKINDRRVRQIEKLRMKYGKNDLYVSTWSRNAKLHIGRAE